jgi:beta-glucanase (GH16 family)
MKFRSILFFWFFQCILLQGCQNGNDVTATPVVTTDAVSEFRKTVDTDFEFKISIPHASASDVSVDYVTSDGTAVAGIDFIFTSGTAVIPAGSLSSIVKVKVKGDSLRRDFQVFHLNVNHPVNCTIADTDAIGKIENRDGLYFPVDSAGYHTSDSHLTLVWSDEFNGRSIDETKWSFDIGNNGWGNHELQYYTNRTQNAFVSSGNLIIEARKENYYGDFGDFTSARLTTMGKKNFKYGRIEIRAKVPGVEGFMSALWMMGSNVGSVGWPGCGEIAIMQLPHSENVVYSTLRWGDSPTSVHQAGNNRSLGVVNENPFHVFTASWDANDIAMYVDDSMVFHKATGEGGSPPFDHDFFLIFNLAVGGDWPGPPNATTQFPQRLVIDYVRVFQ